MEFSFFISCYIAFMLSNSVDPDEMPQFVASHQGLHCLRITIYRHIRIISYGSVCLSQFLHERVRIDRVPKSYLNF